MLDGIIETAKWVWAAIAWQTLAAWVSGLGALYAARVALRGYHLHAELQREDRAVREQAETRRIEAEKLEAVRQIAVKLGKLLNDCGTTVGTLSSRGEPADKWLECRDPIQIVAGQPPIISVQAARYYALTPMEENLLIALQEEAFLMDYAGALQVAEMTETALREYSARYQVVFSMLEGDLQHQGDQSWLSMLRQPDPVVLPYAVQAASLVQEARRLSVSNLKVVTALAGSFHVRMSKHLPGLDVPSITFVPAELASDDLRTLHCEG